MVEALETTADTNAFNNYWSRCLREPQVKVNVIEDPEMVASRTSASISGPLSSRTSGNKDGVVEALETTVRATYPKYQVLIETTVTLYNESLTRERK